MTASRTRAAWTIVGLLWAVALLNYLDRQLVVTMPGPIKSELHIGDEKLGLLSSVFLWIYGIVSPVAGYLADRFGKRRVILASLAVWSIATFASGMATSFGEMLAARAMLGISEAFYMPAAVALIIDYHRPSTRSRATGLHLSGVYAGSVLGGLGGALAEAFGWRPVFLAIGGFGVAYAIVLSIVFPSRPPARPEQGAEDLVPGHFLGAIGSLLSMPGFLLLLAMNLLNGAAYWPVRNWLAEFFRSELGVTPAWAGVYGPMAFNGAAFVGMLIASNVSDWWVGRCAQARTFVPAIGFFVAAPCLLGMGAIEYVPAVLACVLVAGMSQGFLDANLMPATCTVVDIRTRATACGLLNLVGMTAGGAMTYAGGRLKEQDVPFGAVFQAAGVMILIAGILLLLVRPRQTTAGFSAADGLVGPVSLRDGS